MVGKVISMFKTIESYEGESLKGKPHGKGSIIYKDKSRYVGLFNNGALEGAGTYISNDGICIAGRWRKGNCISGSMTSPCGVLYTGLMKQMVFHGKGMLSMLSGNIIIGNFDKGIVSGKAVMADQGKEIVKGIWENSALYGKGIVISADGDVRRGFWRNDKFNVITSNKIPEFQLKPSGKVEPVNKTDNAQHFEGKVFFEDNSYYYGDLKNNTMHGFGSYCWDDNSYFTGQWSNNKPSGYGCLSFYSGEVLYGQWKGFKQSGYGLTVFPDGRKYIGKYKNGMMDDFGILLGNYGEIVQGEWCNDDIKGWASIDKGDGVVISGFLNGTVAKNDNCRIFNLNKS